MVKMKIDVEDEELAQSLLELLNRMKGVRTNVIAQTYSDEEKESAVGVASEPVVVYGVNRARRVPISEVMKNSMTLEESENLITQKIYKHFHPEV